MDGLDVVGDIHGHHDELICLLRKLGYSDDSGVWKHPERRVVFVGDMIDRGSHQLQTLTTVRRMVDAGTALIVAGNHEFNAVAFHTPHPSGDFCRPHRSAKNFEQHAEFLEQVGWFTDTHDEWISWFRTLPLWLDLEDLRVVHAAWDDSAVEAIKDHVGPNNTLTHDLVVAASRQPEEDTQSHSPWSAIEVLLKGPEIAISPPYLDKGGHERNHARFQWWLSDADTLDRGALIPPGTKTTDGSPYPAVPKTRIDTSTAMPYRGEVPVIFGHYWRTGTPELTSHNTACVDYSAGKGGPLVAYQWSGESTLTPENFTSSRSGPSQ